MIIPVRCFSCGKPIAQHWEEYTERLKNNEKPGKIMDDLGLERYCCRQMFLGHVELFDLTAQFRKS
ncbi:DNA-directed RNA polymerase subunit N [Candidatus Woesearchaeota archaeon]|nr:DNA-directed RNA polymerase subunit N [Candidatus Woesearchaeota archaeon]